MKKIILFLGMLLSFSILLSCNNDDDTNETPVNFPIVIDYHQVVGRGEVGNEPHNGYFSYQQDGLTVEIIDFERISYYYVEEVGGIWLYPARLKISNINALKGLSKISFNQFGDPTHTRSLLYDANDNVIEEYPFYQPYPSGGYIFETNLDQASYLIIEGYENLYSSITFE